MIYFLFPHSSCASVVFYLNAFYFAPAPDSLLAGNQDCGCGFRVEEGGVGAHVLTSTLWTLYHALRGVLCVVSIALFFCVVLLGVLHGVLGVGCTLPCALSCTLSCFRPFS